MIATLIAGSLNRLIFLSTFLVTLLPVGLLAAWWTILAEPNEGPKDDPLHNRALAEAQTMGRALDLWMTQAESELRSWGEAPALINGVRRAAVEHHDRGYTERTPQAVNARLVHDRHLGLAPEADEYLAVQVGKSKAWAQAHYSDEYGFTVGVAGLEEDFVQTDESWWQAAWNRGRHESDISFNENANGFAFRIALRMNDPATKAAVGVIDGTIALTAVQRLANGFAAERSSVRILDEKGRLIADTASGHARDRIMRLSQDAMNSEGWRQGVGSPGNAGGTAEGQVERGWVRLAEASRSPSRLDRHRGTLDRRDVRPSPGFGGARGRPRRGARGLVAFQRVADAEDGFQTAPSGPARRRVESGTDIPGSRRSRQGRDRPTGAKPGETAGDDQASGANSRQSAQVALRPRWRARAAAETHQECAR